MKTKILLEGEVTKETLFDLKLTIEGTPYGIGAILHAMMEENETFQNLLIEAVKIYEMEHINTNLEEGKN